MGFGKNDFGFGGGGGSGGGGNQNYLGDSPSTVTVQNIPSGTDISGYTLSGLLSNIYAPYVSPSFASFSVGQSTPIEVGTTISGNKSFTWTFNAGQNVSANTMAILDVTASTTLASGLSITPPASVSIGTITNSAPAIRQWKGRATNSRSATFDSGIYQVNWYWKLWYGTNAAPILDSTAIQALASNALKANILGIYNLAAGDYKYFVWDDSLGSPTASTGFKDNSTGLALAMASVGDDAFYSNVQNGWYYGLVSVTSNGITSNKRVYRTKNMLGGTLQAIVS